MSIPWRGLVRISILAGLLALIVAAVIVNTARERLAVSPRMPIRFTEIRCDTMGVMIAASQVRIDKANADLKKEGEKLKDALSNYAQCKAGLESALIMRPLLGDGANVEGWRTSYELWRTGVEWSRAAYESALKEVMDANAESADLPRSSSGYRASIQKIDYKWKSYLQDPRYDEFWNPDLTLRARWMLPVIAAAVVMLGTIAMPAAWKVLFGAAGSTRRWVGDGFSKKDAPATEEAPVVDRD